jgi:predicted nucleic acid-binding protein
MTGSFEPFCFLDSNIWIYALADNQELGKHDVACKLVDSEGVVVSTQVINEVCVNLIKKSAFSETQIQALIRSFYDGCDVIELNQIILTSASNLRSNYALSFWDSLIVASALQAGTSILYSEDMQAGLVISNQLEVVNPFK